MKKTWRPAVKLFRLPLILLLVLPASLARAKGETASSPTNYEMVEAPTAYTLMHGGYDLVTRMYEGGGLSVRGNVGFEDFFMFGFSGNATNVVGQGTIQIQTPGIGLKFRVLDEKVAPVALAVGWDNRGYGTQTNGIFFPGTQKGFYSVVSHEFKELGYLQAHGGINAVTFDNFDSSQDLGVFFGTSFAVAEPLLFNIEVDKLLSSYWQFNANVMFNVDNPLRVGVDFRDINRGDLFSRIVRVQYMGFF